jgi:ubiquinol-cytochrome c reductase cytochrome b subunit
MKKSLALIAGIGLMVSFFLAVAGAGDISGEKLTQSLGCLGCHSLGGNGGDRGPAWDGVGSRLTPEAIKKQIVSPRGRMPSFAQIKPEELEALVKYLSGLK